MSGKGKDAPGEVDRSRLPRHIAIIMDGNGRWARKRLMPRYLGHRAGLEAVRKTVEQCIEYGVEVLTLFAFSSENWRRPKKEVGMLMDLFMSALNKEVRRLDRNGVRLRIIGAREAFPQALQDKIAEAERKTAGNDKLVLQIAANYGGRWDVTQAARILARRVARGEMDPEAIDEAMIASELAFPDLPDPDLFIRTGGEQRLSNFVLWQAAYAELYFTDLLWPDFDAQAFADALISFAGRERRFGRTSEQVQGEDGA